MDMVFESFVDGQKYQEKVLEFSFHLHHCMLAEVQVRQGYVCVGGSQGLRPYPESC